jgi:hypothetical protein
MAYQSLMMSSLTDFYPESVGGVRMTSCHGLISSLIEDEIGPEAALFLAEPVGRDLKNAIEWITPLEGDPVDYRTLEGDAREDAADALSLLIGSLAGLGSRLTGSESEQRRLAGKIISKLAVGASDAAGGRWGPLRVFIVGGAPVMAGWGLGESAVSRRAGAASDALTERDHEAIRLILAGGEAAPAAAGVAPAAPHAPPPPPVPPAGGPDGPGDGQAPPPGPPEAPDARVGQGDGQRGEAGYPQGYPQGYYQEYPQEYPQEYQQEYQQEYLLDDAGGYREDGYVYWEGPAAPAPPGPGCLSRIWRPLLAALLVFILALALLLLLRPGVRGALFLEIPDDSRVRALQAELDSLRGTYLSRLAACPVGAGPQAGAAPPPPDPPPEPPAPHRMP